jgi:hypothetical protein
METLLILLLGIDPCYCLSRLIITLISKINFQYVETQCMPMEEQWMDATKTPPSWLL